ncbi:hypothetical protein PQR66_27590 [Paraburkholderia agricolaris]|uniref:Surface-adhesin protein E-like domain-containing protein n=1 Tax=Paraburkholderia agricolaris TaxID=2152888 RepID=A0ABW8ZXL6_9BURK
MRTFAILIAGLLVGAAAMAAEPNWVAVGKTDHYMVWVDSNSIKETAQQTVEFWMRGKFTPPVLGMATSISHIVARCDHPATYVRDVFSTFDEQDKPFHRDNGQDEQPLFPGSSMDAVITRACSLVPH